MPAKIRLFISFSTLLSLLISTPKYINSATPSLVTPFMVVPFTDLRVRDAENLIYLVLSGFITRPTLPASLLISAHIASRAGRLLSIIKISSAYQQICVSLFKIVLLCSKFFSALWRTRLNNVADKSSPCLIPLLITKGLLIFPSTITLP